MARAARCERCGGREALLIWGQGQAGRRADARPGVSAYICQGCGCVVTLESTPASNAKQPEPELTT